MPLLLLPSDDSSHFESGRSFVGRESRRAVATSLLTIPEFQEEGGHHAGGNHFGGEKERITATYAVRFDSLSSTRVQ